MIPCKTATSGNASTGSSGKGRPPCLGRDEKPTSTGEEGLAEWGASKS